MDHTTSDSSNLLRMVDHVQPWRDEMLATAPVVDVQIDLDAHAMSVEVTVSNPTHDNAVELAQKAALLFLGDENIRWRCSAVSKSEVRPVGERSGHHATLWTQATTVSHAQQLLDDVSRWVSGGNQLSALLDS